MATYKIVDAPSLPVYDLGTQHPFARDRQVALFDLMKRHRLTTTEDFLPTSPADRATLETAHAGAYIAAVEGISPDSPRPEAIQEALRFGLGTSDNPIAPNQHQAAAAVAGATADCVSAVMRGEARHAFNPAGGLHHAMRSGASGFCIYNDLVVGIERARALGAERVLYVDFDVHHGDGVEAAYAADPSVMTISFHETPEVRWPGTGWISERGRGAGEGSVVNMPLASHTTDESWVEAVRAVLVPCTEQFRPDLILSQHGCDPHREDPLAELDLTTGAMHEAVRITRELADRVCDGRWVATGGGGYQPLRVIPRVWSGVWAIMTGREIPAQVDPDWIAHWQPKTPAPLAKSFLDPELPHPRHQAAAARNRDTLDRLLPMLS